VAKNKAAKKVRGHSAPSIIIPEVVAAVAEAATPPEVKLEVEEVEEDKDKELASLEQTECIGRHIFVENVRTLTL
jgi:hypothetical protein